MRDNVLIQNSQLLTSCVNHMCVNPWKKEEKPYRISNFIFFSHASHITLHFFLILDCTYALNHFCRTDLWRLDKLALQEMLIPYLDAESNWAENMLQQLQNWCNFELTPDSMYNSTITEKRNLEQKIKLC